VAHPDEVAMSNIRSQIAVPTVSDRIIPQLLNEEYEMEQIRLRGDIGYSVARHIDLLIALMAEAQHLPGERHPG
jgi:hypothetical protein